jgi:hypothetical protein
VDFLAYSAYVLLAGFWQAALRAGTELANGSSETAFYHAKLHAADFYWRRVLPRHSSSRGVARRHADCLMAMPACDFMLVADPQ